MPQLKTYDLFISHCWRYNDEYYSIIRMLENANYFYWRNYSVPEHDPVIDKDTNVGKVLLTTLLDRQIKPVNCVLILAGMYTNHSYWICTEIDLAQKYDKPIIGIVPRGQERTPKIIQDAAHTMVYWNTDSIVSAIRNYSI